jgi:hypothetical protein
MASDSTSTPGRTFRALGTPRPTRPSLPDAQLIALQELRDAALNGTDALKVAWKAAGSDTRRALADELPALKAAAAEADRA